MIRLLVRLGAWLDKRFPEKVVITKELHDAIHRKVTGLEGELSEVRDIVYNAKNSIEVLVSRIGTLESDLKKAAHVGAVQDLIVVVKGLKDEFSSLKTHLGMNSVAQSSPEPAAYLNGEALGEQHGE